MRLVVSEKNIAARRIAEILAVGKPKADKVYNTPIYTFRRDGEDWIAIGLKGHILGVDFPQRLVHEKGAWYAEWEEGIRTLATIPDTLTSPPWPKPVRKPFSADGIDLKTWRLQSLPYLVWTPIGKHPTEKEIVRSLRSLAKKADEVIIATDFDREGELIGADARGLVREVNFDVPISRARFSAITNEEIERAFTDLGLVSDELAAAGGARQDIDLVWGAVLTRYLTKVRFSGVARPRSAGRVQTPTLKLIVDRELEREAFNPETYWTVKAEFAKDGTEFAAGHATERFKSEAAAVAARDKANGALGASGDLVDGRWAAGAGMIAEVATARRTVKPPTPFNTTALLTTAASEGIAPARTMRIAESLYMSGLISYPRVDNSVYPPSLDLAGILKTLDAVPAYHEHVGKLLKSGPLTPTRGAKETTDHPPIHPTGAADPEKLKPEEYKLYNLVARRFMATLSDSAVLESTKVGIDVGGERFIARGDVIVTPGFRSVYPYGLKKDEHLPAMPEGASVDFAGANMEEKQTQPPARYSQGKLIQEMEKRGLGTKATRHDIIQTLSDRRYANGDPVEPTCLGRTVIEALSQFAERITTPGMTAELEAEMDAIANGRDERTRVVNHSRELLADVMEVLLPKAQEVGDMLKAAATEDSRVGTCPKSGHDLLIKSSAKTRSQFVGCGGWPECDVTYPLPDGGIEPVEEVCPECGTPQVKIIQFKRKPLVRCLDPQCPTNKVEETFLGACPTCAKDGREGRITRRVSPRTLKQYARCTNYDTCATSYPLPQSGDIEATGEICEPCGSPIIVAMTRKGPWRICLDPGCSTKDKTAKGEAKGGAKPAAKGGTKPAKKRPTASKRSSSAPRKKSS